ncbi:MULTISPECIES: hypothetical protein [Mycobacteroides]|uniref:hypothetical protein n=1 Tax=Mycobacteroides TaxID=670516 RepID=UPI000925BB1C|nr:hypothetical protein [Mycobacteroides abscessus]NGX06406.1 hypothetical protein [Mycobacteroides franklinii]SHT24114.1 Uncharacterised protein [Mycobacteroides abscessus subsp. abscessus]SHW68175.1 Uncharacterised protein [Mycobacteroides abscessus subsp. abscessus]SHY69625.1 Uncharacterised protein [Mycobacteroides abscessus subsp. abscessus]SHZ45808.1 Uncharacterised protein [Mycobacteroides abscessus subsp. abscessus]
MQQTTPGIHWDNEYVRNLMAVNKIETREDLAREIYEAPTTVRRSFSNNWQGRPTLRLMAAISYRFNVPVNNLITDPRRIPGRIAAVRRAG